MYLLDWMYSLLRLLLTVRYQFRRMSLALSVKVGSIYLAHPNLPIAALLLPQFPIIVAENYVLPANERVTDGARTRDLL